MKDAEVKLVIFNTPPICHQCLYDKHGSCHENLNRDFKLIIKPH